ncbi:hypothetical protein [Herbiconiux sp. L3-i23]|uniref:hypothetical protein n=1 Tax=Herbiconiux sp. L3-i23 TaxID=2905871 RepID=UPI0020670012|nr:hypothetical protein [Herbiconiux sp. L3-i23]BDI23909.1 hypothetical protein L3i23_26850 [Herbiconiux sp. L3-i23]
MSDTNDRTGNIPEGRRETYRSDGDPEPVVDEPAPAAAADATPNDTSAPVASATDGSRSEADEAPLAAPVPARAENRTAPTRAVDAPAEADPASAERTNTVPAPLAPETDSSGPAHRAPDVAAADAVATAPPTPEPVVTEHPVASAPPASAVADADARADAKTEVTPVATPTVAAPVPTPTVETAPTAPTTATGPAERTDEPRTDEPRTVYLEAPAPPKKKGNRGFGTLIALLAAIAFALVWAGAAALIIAVGTPADLFAESFTNFVLSAAFWVPIIAFFVGLVIVVLLFNRAGWPLYIIGGLIVAVLVYGGYLLGAVITVAQQITPSEVTGFLSRISISPLAIAAGIAAREVSIWSGAAIAARGRRVKAKNAQAQADYEKASAERKAEYERARTGAHA